MDKIKTTLTDEQKDLIAESFKMKTNNIKYPLTELQSKLWTYKFWKNQPVIFDKTKLNNLRQLETLKSTDVQVDIGNTLEWNMCTKKDTEMLQEYCDFLNIHYKESNFKTFYTRSYFEWVLKNGSLLLVSHKSSKRIYGGIIGVPKTYLVNNTKQTIVDVNYLCVHPSLRNTGLAEKLISQLVNVYVKEGYQVGLFNTERYIPTPFTTVTNYIYPLNVEKLLSVNYFTNMKDEDKKIYMSKYFVEPINNMNIVKVTKDNIEEVFNFYKNNSPNSNFSQEYSQEEFTYWFLNEYTRSYVIMNNSKIEDFFAVYYTPTHDTKLNLLSEAYLYTYTSYTYTARRMINIIKYVSKTIGCDVLHLDNTQESKDIVEDYYKEYLEVNKKNYNLYNMESPVFGTNNINLVFFA